MKAILLAAGFSSRMGRLKQVMPIAGVPMVRHIAESFLSADMQVVVVLGHRSAEIMQALEGLPCEYVLNSRPESGMFSSVQCGCAVVEAGNGCLIMPGDCPGVRPATIRFIRQHLYNHPKQVIVPTFQEHRGHPVGVPAPMVDRIRTLPADTPGLRTLWHNQPEMVLHVNVDDEAVLRDLDRPEDVETQLTHLLKRQMLSDFQ
jgi:CTP:molybdopterin cytidylyltransferase MocA